MINLPDVKYSRPFTIDLRGNLTLERHDHLIFRGSVVKQSAPKSGLKTLTGRMVAGRPVLSVAELSAATTMRGGKSSRSRSAVDDLQYDDRWPGAVRVTVMLGLSLSMWAGIGAAAWNLMHH